MAKSLLDQKLMNSTCIVGFNGVADKSSGQPTLPQGTCTSFMLTDAANNSFDRFGGASIFHGFKQAVEDDLAPEEADHGDSLSFNFSAGVLDNNGSGFLLKKKKADEAGKEMTAYAWFGGPVTTLEIFS